MKIRFSGHESFPCRYTWLPKAYKAISENPNIFSDDNLAMVKLGVGKNMVKAIRFWVQVFGVAAPHPSESGLRITSFGRLLFGNNGLDPFLEDIRTLWLLHWKVSSIPDDPLFAWHFLMNQWSGPSFSRSQVIEGFTRESERMERPLSDFTKEQHFDIFLHTYLRVRPKKDGDVLEDSLDCPLTELQFIVPAGERLADEGGKRESVYEFRLDINMDVSPGLFAYCLFDFWQKNRSKESTISFRDVSTVTGSVGQIFKLNEADIRVRLDSLVQDSGGVFEYMSSAAESRIIIRSDLDESTEIALLKGIYQKLPNKTKPIKKTSLVHGD